MQLDLTIATEIAARLKALNHTLAVVESSTGGLICASLLAVPGASRFFVGGAVVYTQQAREALIGITADDMKDTRSASEPYAAMIAQKIRTLHGATWGLAETGAAGPSGNRYGDPAGHCCIAISGPHNIRLTMNTDNDDRSENMVAFSAHALSTFNDFLNSHG